jgi:asparagine synthase (glutamine-hydrolysing)
MSMAHSVEARYPFLDHNVVQLFNRMPDELKLQGMNEKHILKETFKDVLPQAIIKRNKQPYRAPEAVSLLQGTIKDRFLNEDINKKHRFFDWDTVKRLENKLSASEGNFSFNENFAYVIIAATMIFLELFDDKVDLNTPPRHDCFFHETVI